MSERAPAATHVTSSTGTCFSLRLYARFSTTNAATVGASDGRRAAPATTHAVSTSHSTRASRRLTQPAATGRVLRLRGCFRSLSTSARSLKT